MAEKQKSKFLETIKTKILYKVDPEEKHYVKGKVMQEDHGTFKWLLFVIFILQIIMIIYKLVSKSGNLTSKDSYYIYCYSGLAAFSIIAYFASEYCYSHDKRNAYFYIVAGMVDIFFIWSLCIALLDSIRGTELTTYAYTTLAIAALIILEPWVFILDSIVFSTALCLCVSFIPSLTIYPSVIISAISIAILISIIGIVNFNRRINSTILQREVLDLNKILNKQSYFDALTDIYNRRYLTDHINDSMNLGITPSCVLMFDIDDFKQLNDKYGHSAGDDCLTKLGELIRVFVDKHPNSYAVRYGGEEFLIYIPKIDKMKVLKDAEEFRLNVEQSTTITKEGAELKYTISIGLALANVGLNYSGLINKADACLYNAKRNGKNKVAIE